MNRNEMQIEKRLKHLLDLLRPVPARDPEVAARGKANFLKQAETLRTTVSRQPERRHTGRTNRVFSLFQRKERAPVLNTLIAVVLAVAVFFGGTGATVYAAQDSLPDEPLYPVKTLSEEALISLTASPQRQVDLTLDFADRRVAEMVGLQSAGRPIPQGVADRLQNELDSILELVAGMDDPAMAQVLKQILLRAETQLQTTTMLMAGNPADPTLRCAHARIREQVQLAAMGEADPQGFRLQIRRRFQYHHGAPTQTPGDGQKGPGPVNSEGTPNPGGTPMPGGGGNGPGPGGNQSTETPGQHGPGPQSPNRTPQPGGGSGHGP